MIPPAKRGGNKRRVDVREVMNGIMYILSTGCQWRAVPKDLPPRSTLFDYLDLWSWDGTLDRIHHALYVECREQSERQSHCCHHRQPEREKRGKRCYGASGDDNGTIVAPANQRSAPCHSGTI
jgi:transposase